jgi:hypothetical protein
LPDCQRGSKRRDGIEIAAIGALDEGQAFGAMLRLDRLQASGGFIQRLFPGDSLPFIFPALAKAFEGMHELIGVFKPLPEVGRAFTAYRAAIVRKFRISFDAQDFVVLNFYQKSELQWQPGRHDRLLNSTPALDYGVAHGPVPEHSLAMFQEGSIVEGGRTAPSFERAAVVCNSTLNKNLISHFSQDVVRWRKPWVQGTLLRTLQV